MTRFLIDGPPDASRTYVFAHGAGGPMLSPFMKSVARGIAAAGIRVVRFEFPYMAARRKRPDPQNVLLDCFRDVVSELGDARNLVIGGKSMGGRMATMVADDAFGSQTDVASYALTAKITIEWIHDGDHSLGKNLDQPIALGVRFITSI
jgi:predicted alpha/beta-hydrolase family hydrolase